MSRHQVRISRQTAPISNFPLFRLTPIARVIQVVFVGSLLAVAGWQPQAYAQIVSPQPRQATAEARHYDIPAGPLSTVLARFASESGVLLAAAGDLTQGKSSPGVNGTLDVRTALNAILAGTGLQAVIGNGGAYELHQIPVNASGTTTLPAIAVTGTAIRESPTEPVAGYLATRNLTATKTDTPIIQTPQAISVVTADQIRATHAQTLQEALGYTAGIEQGMVGLNPSIADTLYIRGFQADSQFGSFYRDGMRYMANIYNGKQEPYGLERVEVLKGPSSILYGAAAPGGVINAISKRPLFDPYHEINVEYGSHNRKQISGDFSGPVDDDGKWAYRLTMLERKSDTFIDYGRDDRTYIAPALTWRPSAQTSLTLLASYQRAKQSDAGTLPIFGTLLPNPNGELPRGRYLGEPDHNEFNTTTTSVGYEFEHTFSDNLKFTNRLRKYDSTLDFDYFLMNGLQDNRLLGRQSRFQHDNTSIWSSDTNLQYDLQTGPVKQTLLVGIDYSNSDYRSHRERGALAPIDIYNPVYGTGVDNQPWRELQSKQRQTGIYLQDQIKVYDKWVLLLGGRHDRYTTEDVFNGEVTPRHDSATTGRAGLVYLADNGLAPYVSYTQSFSPTAGTDAAGNTYQADHGEQYEAGLRYQPPGSATMITAAVYQLTRKNVLTPDPVNIGFSVQTGEVRSRGLELEIRSKINKSIDVIGSYAYTDARVTQSNTPEAIGSRFTGAPYHTAALWVDVNFGFAGLPGLVAGSGVRYVSSKPGSVTDASFGVPGYTLLDARLGYTQGNWSYTLNFNNLTNKRYIPSVCYNSVIGCDYGAPRTIVASVSYRW